MVLWCVVREHALWVVFACCVIVRHLRLIYE
jgi:hypothetical protein